ncbi:dUTP diphosphatase [Corynebacterium aurimucosum]|uniref:dUTP diphosphatase n=1 Tax=Corynebacterium aurimucosum TaxID=169292 RepID=UPI00187AAAE1|nr:dUTP diphosphatase [Corynebacterium aurimucosum]MBE7365104.1 dUTP diphosphatase [Corynebacterium aurimucosum]
MNEQHPLVDPVSPFGDIQIKRLDKELPLPQRAHRGDAGADLYAAHDATLRPGERALVGTGITLALPMGTVGLVHPRSGLAAKHGISVVNTPGTIDAEYRGEIKVCLINHDPEKTFEVERGMRIAQLVVQRVELVGFREVEELDDTARGDGGYGSTGVN